MTCTSFLRKIAIIPIYKDMTNVLRVLPKFRERIVDEICLVIDCLTKYEIELARARINIVSTKKGIPIRIFTDEERKGIGYAIRKGIKYALANGYDVIVVMAGNNKDDPSEIPRLLTPIIKEGCDYVQGSRFLPGGRHIKNPFLRGIFSRIYPFFWTLLTNIRCTDVTNGFRAYRTTILKDKRINIWQRWLDGYGLEYYLHFKALKLGYKIQEVPVSKVYPYRHRGGYSRISPLKDCWQIVSPLIFLSLGIKK